jgi:Protein of unknown function (DUF1488)
MSQLVFSDDRCTYDSENHGVRFRGYSDGSLVRCFVSVEALERYCGLRGDPAVTAIPAFRSCEQTIRSICRPQISGRGEVVVTDEDFGHA